MQADLSSSPEPSSGPNQNPRFSLRALFVLVTCIACLLGLLIRLVHTAREEARRMTCSGHLKQLALCIHNYESATRTVPASFDRQTQSGASSLPITGSVLPSGSPLDFEGSPVAGNGFFQWNKTIQFDSVADGLSNTLCFGEMSWVSRRHGTRYRSWLHGGTDGSYAASCRNIARAINSHRLGDVLAPFNDMPMGSQHRGGANFAMADGAVLFLSESIDMAIYQAMATIDGGEAQSPPAAGR